MGIEGQLGLLEYRERSVDRNSQTAGLQDRRTAVSREQMDISAKGNKSTAESLEIEVQQGIPE